MDFKTKEALEYFITLAKEEHALMVDKNGGGKNDPSLAKYIIPIMINRCLDIGGDFEYNGEIYFLKIGDPDLPFNKTMPIIIKHGNDTYYAGAYEEVFQNVPWDLFARIPRSKKRK